MSSGKIKNKWFKKGYKEGFKAGIGILGHLETQFFCGVLSDPEDSAMVEIRKFFQKYPDKKGKINKREFLGELSRFIINDIFEELTDMYLENTEVE